MVLSLKQLHANFYRLYEKGTTRAMVDFQGLHSSNASQHPNVSACMGLKSFCLWCFKFGENTNMIATNLREVHYRLSISCDICWVFTSMSMQVVLEHQSRCRMRSHKKSKIKKPPKTSINESCRVIKVHETFHPILLLSMDSSSHSSWLGLHRTIQQVIFQYQLT